MIRKAIMLVVVAGALSAALVASSAIAGDTPTGVGSQAACNPGSCFAPGYSAAGEVAKYKGPAATTVSFADCCIAGTSYKGKAGGMGNSAGVKWTSSGTLDNTCSPFPHPDTHSLSIVATKAQLKIISNPAGFPASAYVGMDVAGWEQTQGSDICGF